MSAEHRRNRRLVRLVGAMKRGKYPNARSMSCELARKPDTDQDGALCRCIHRLEQTSKILHRLTLGWL